MGIDHLIDKRKLQHLRQTHTRTVPITHFKLNEYGPSLHSQLLTIVQTQQLIRCFELILKKYGPQKH